MCLQTLRKVNSVLHSVTERQGSDALPTVSQVELIQFNYDVPNTDRDPRTGKLMYKVGATSSMPTFAIRLTSDRGIGEYVAHMGGRPSVFAQWLQSPRGCLVKK